MSERAPRHPEAQTMAAFVDGTLPTPDVAVVAEHLRDCLDCRMVVSETARFEREEQQTRPRTLPWWLAVAAVIAAMAIVIPLLRWNESRHASPIAHLIAAAPLQHRTVDARLSGFPWARLQAPPRGQALPDPADLKLSGAAGDVLEKTANVTTMEARHATGVAYLLIGRQSESISALDEAAQHSNDATVWNDLAAARYAFADAHSSQLPDALADADHAIRLDPKSPEAHFNRALILERLGVRDQARKEWQRYLDLDGGSAWSVEARAHLGKLESGSSRFRPSLLEATPAAQLVRQWPEETRRWSEGVLLPDWADAEGSGDSVHASTRLGRLRSIAGALAAFNGEHLLDDAVAAIERSNASSRRVLAEAHRLYRQARLDYSKRVNRTAEGEFRRAATLFHRGGSPMSEVSTYFAASAAFDQNRGNEAHDQLSALLSRIDRGRDRALTAQDLRTLAVYENSVGDWGSAARDSEESEGIFRALGEHANAAAVDAIAAQTLEQMGNDDLAWTRRLRALSELGGDADRDFRNTILQTASGALVSIDRNPAAVALLDLTIDDDRKADPAVLAVALADRSRLAGVAGDAEGARHSLARARDAAMRIADQPLRDDASAHIELADAAMRLTWEPRAAVVSLSHVIGFFGAQQLSGTLPGAFLLRARASRAAGDETAALADYTAALHEVEKQRISIPETAFGMNFLDTASQIIDETIDLDLSRGSVTAAFEVADRSHALPGASLMGSPAVSPLPSHLAVVEYSVLPHAVALFCITRDGVTAEKIAMDRHELAARVDAFAQRIRGRAPIDEIRRDGALLYEVLVAPLQSHLDGYDEIVFVPDRQLYGLPFAALYDKRRARFLVDELTIRFAPAALGAQQVAQAPLRPAVVIADPPTALGPPLPASREEAQQIAAIHGATLISGEAATRARFVDAARRSALIHYAGHADSDAGRSYGALLLAGSAGDSGLFGSSDVARLSLPLQPLVVLAACGTFRGDAMHVAGMTSLARAFLIAGARGVVGTLWEVDDDVSAQLFLRFHEHLRAGASPAAALREAQRAMLLSSDPRLRHPATWAAVEVLSHV